MYVCIIIIYYAKMQHIQYKSTHKTHIYTHTATRTHKLSSRKESGHDRTQRQQNVSTYDP